MQADSNAAVQRLRGEFFPLRGLWRGFEADLARMGVTSLVELRTRDPVHLMKEYCRMTTRPDDPVLVPYFRALVSFAATGVATPWWCFLREQALREREPAFAQG